MQPQGVRVAWDQVARNVRDQVAAGMGSPVVAAENQPGGFSPGVAARCELADGRRCFIKAVSSDQNPDSPAMHRREARITAALPSGLPVPSLQLVVDDGHWVVLVFEEIEGHIPSLPWTIPQLGAVFDALDALAAATTPCTVPDLISFAVHHAPTFNGYRTLAGDDPTADRIDGDRIQGDRVDPSRIDPWSRRHLTRLAELEAEWPDAAVGQTLLHADLRADNLLVRPDGTIVVVDWPHACVGAAWVDKLCMLPSVGLDSGPSPAEVDAALHPFEGIDAGRVDRVLVALAGYFTYHGARPDPPGLPTLRAFQRSQGELARAWLADRLTLP